MDSAGDLKKMDLEGEGDGVETKTMNKKQKLDPVNKVSDSDEFQISYEDIGERIGIKDKYSNFTRERVSSVQVTKAQYTAEIDEEEEIFYKSDAYKTCKHRSATNAELKLLLDASYQSQGFDIPFLAGAAYLPIHRVNLTCEASAINVAQLSKCALRWYNRAKKDDPDPEPSKLVDLEIEEDYDEELVGFNNDDDDYDDDDDDEAQEDDDSDEETQEDVTIPLL